MIRNYLGKGPLIIALVGHFVNASWAAGFKSTKLNILVEKLLANGEDDSNLYGGAHHAADLGLPDPVPSKSDGATEEETTDNLYRICSLLVDKSDSAKIKPLGFIFRIRKTSGLDAEAFFIRTALDGTIERASVHHGKDNEDGTPVRGSAVVAPLDINSPEVKKRLQRELDFWLKGKYREDPKPYLAEFKKIEAELRKKEKLAKAPSAEKPVASSAQSKSP